MKELPARLLAFSMLLGVILLHPGQVWAAEPPALVTVTPNETDEILANPGMGWETFHRTADDDKNLPPWIPSTVHYARWGWRTLEPEEGKIDYNFLDGVLNDTRRAGQTLAFRAMCCSTYPRQPYHPKWLPDIGGKVVSTRYGNGPELQVPVLDDPEVLETHLDFIKRLGARYDGHPDIDHIDLGSVGWWGEWHMSQSSNAPMPTLETQKKIVDTYLAAFKDTPLLMLIGGGPMLKYATQRGTGWRADCLGDMGGFSRTWCHMRMAYPQRLPEAGAVDVWKTAPVAWETCWDMRKWMDEGWSLPFIFNYALALHGSVINNKSAPLPEGEDIRPEVERFLRRLGYRLVLRELKHPSTARPGDKIQLAMKWQNIGSAPCYKPYRVAYRMSNDQGYEGILVGTVTVNKWLPGAIKLFTEEFFKQPTDLPPGKVHAVADTIQLLDDLSPGTYRLSVGVVGVDTTHPVVQLGIKGRDDDGWYPLSKILVSEAPAVRQDERTAPDFSRLKEGIALSQAKAILDSSGRLRENSSPEEAIYDFDFDEKSAVLIVNRRSTPAIVTKVIIWKHGKTVEQVRADRRKKWSEWVEAHSPKKHDGKKSEPVDAPDKR